MCDIIEFVKWLDIFQCWLENFKDKVLEKSVKEEKIW